LSADDSARLTVLHVDTERGWRGGEQHVLWLADALRRAGHRSIIAARADEPLAARASTLGLTIVPCAPAVEFSPRCTLALRRAITRERVDVVHAHTAHAVALAALATMRGLAPMVATRHINFALRRNPGTKWKYGRAHAIIAVSESVALSLRESGIDPHRIEVIEGGVDLSRLPSPAARATMRELGIPDGAPLAVMVAALVPQKDPVTFVRAIQRARQAVPNLHALIVGDGTLSGDVREEVARTGLTGAVTLAGWRDDADALLAHADIAVLSSRHEGLPVVLMMALALAKPIAATAAGGIPEMLRGCSCGTVVSIGDADALGNAIAGIVRDPALARRMGEASRVRATNYAIDRVAERTAAVYRKVIAHHTRAYRDRHTRTRSTTSAT
jgi:glycosyltransferase involved in cell wall biosynthesis